MSRSLFDALLEEEPIKWTEEDIITYLDKEKFESYHIRWLLELDFRKKP